MSELRKIPNVGPQTERDLIAMGYTTIESLKGKSAEELYSEECRLRGCIVDRCQLYLYRAVEYFVNTPKPNLHNAVGGYGRTILPCPHHAERSAYVAKCSQQNVVDAETYAEKCTGLNTPVTKYARFMTVA